MEDHSSEGGLNDCDEPEQNGCTAVVEQASAAAGQMPGDGAVWEEAIFNTRRLLEESKKQIEYLRKQSHLSKGRTPTSGSLQQSTSSHSSAAQAEVSTGLGPAAVVDQHAASLLSGCSGSFDGNLTVGSSSASGAALVGSAGSSESAEVPPSPLRRSSARNVARPRQAASGSPTEVPPSPSGGVPRSAAEPQRDRESTGSSRAGSVVSPSRPARKVPVPPFVAGGSTSSKRPSSASRGAKRMYMTGTRSADAKQRPQDSASFARSPRTSKAVGETLRKSSGSASGGMSTGSTHTVLGSESERRSEISRAVSGSTSGSAVGSINVRAGGSALGDQATLGGGAGSISNVSSSSGGGGGLAGVGPGSLPFYVGVEAAAAGSAPRFGGGSSSLPVAPMQQLRSGSTVGKQLLPATPPENASAERREVSDLSDVSYFTGDGSTGAKGLLSNGAGAKDSVMMEQLQLILQDRAMQQQRIDEAQAKLSQLEQQNMNLVRENLQLRSKVATSDGQAQVTQLPQSGVSAVASDLSSIAGTSSVGCASVGWSMQERLSRTAVPPGSSMAEVPWTLSAACTPPAAVISTVTRARSESPGPRTGWAATVFGGPANIVSTSSKTSAVTSGLLGAQARPAASPPMSPPANVCRVAALPSAQVTPSAAAFAAAPQRPGSQDTRAVDTLSTARSSMIGDSCFSGSSVLMTPRSSWRDTASAGSGVQVVSARGSVRGPTNAWGAPVSSASVTLASFGVNAGASPSPAALASSGAGLSAAGRGRAYAAVGRPGDLQQMPQQMRLPAASCSGVTSATG